MPSNDPKSTEKTPKSTKKQNKKSKIPSHGGGPGTSALDLEGANREPRERKVEEKAKKSTPVLSTSDERTDIEAGTDVDTGSIDSDMSSETEERGVAGEDTATKPIRESKNVSFAETNFTKPFAFQPSKGYSPQKFQENSSASQLLNISTLKSIPSTSIMSGESVIKNNDNDYGFSSDPSYCQYLKIIAPAQREGGYKIVLKPVSKVLHLRQTLNNTNYSKHEQETINSIIKESERKLKKPQPKGLKMRFHPFGCVARDPVVIGDDSSSESSSDDAESEDRIATFKNPPITPNPKKRKIEGSLERQKKLTAKRR